MQDWGKDYKSRIRIDLQLRFDLIWRFKRPVLAFLENKWHHRHYPQTAVWHLKASHSSPAHYQRWSVCLLSSLNPFRATEASAAVLEETTCVDECFCRVKTWFLSDCLTGGSLQENGCEVPDCRSGRPPGGCSEPAAVHGHGDQKHASPLGPLLRQGGGGCRRREVLRSRQVRWNKQISNYFFFTFSSEFLKSRIFSCAKTGKNILKQHQDIYPQINLQEPLTCSLIFDVRQNLLLILWFM